MNLLTEPGRVEHTPGPWTLATVPTSIGVCYKVGPFPGKRQNDAPRHACLYGDYASQGNPADHELLANARLIAAAPELLLALHRAAETLSAASAYFKETGKTAGSEVFAIAAENARTAIAKATEAGA